MPAFDFDFDRLPSNTPDPLEILIACEQCDEDEGYAPGTSLQQYLLEQRTTISLSTTQGAFEHEYRR